MGHNSVVSGYPRFIGISWIDGLSTEPSSFGVSHTYYIRRPRTHNLQQPMDPGMSHLLQYYYS